MTDSSFVVIYFQPKGEHPRPYPLNMTHQQTKTRQRRHNTSTTEGIRHVATTHPFYLSISINTSVPLPPFLSCPLLPFPLFLFLIPCSPALFPSPINTCPFVLSFQYLSCLLFSLPLPFSFTQYS
ncbi:hypothetical protein K443DRAFT_564409 [Laccaria amethystina LaAM-08-1]|uniref:Uncharacterized protein n=1 Tax=Laccaria amethystina LaAM-08-1 TaxID=1095629 RepID=A0A0C9XVD1_9AGAR|nr:hypothetical protein K443DRAFT_564409 [Laccaria amethystina LaAM-08-1]